MQIQFDSITFLYITVATVTEYLNFPQRYDEDFIIVDEFDEFVSENPYDIKLNPLELRGIWNMKGKKVFGFTATSSAAIEKITQRIFKTKA